MLLNIHKIDTKRRIIFETWRLGRGCGEITFGHYIAKHGQFFSMQELEQEKEYWSLDFVVDAINDIITEKRSALLRLWLT